VGNTPALYEREGIADGPTVNLHGHEAGNGGRSQWEPTSTAPVLDPSSPLGLFLLNAFNSG